MHQVVGGVLDGVVGHLSEGVIQVLLASTSLRHRALELLQARKNGAPQLVEQNARVHTLQVLQKHFGLLLRYLTLDDRSNLPGHVGGLVFCARL